ncbi:MAG: 2-C-methyl-D-erythritol 4-phosphate cytidylyltransferase [Clostridia bacterium]|nr:2-C-methyl-D-erythritol 4-phosphate cytidylyltransferase [Clostridia bacterium]
MSKPTEKKKSQPNKLAGILRIIAGKPAIKNYTSAVIVAAGSSTRMGGDVTKQFMDLDGLPIVVRTLLAYENTDCIHEIVVVAKEDEMPLYEGMKEAYGITKLTQIVKGGETRQESARNGSDAVSKDAQYIAIADAARCLITPGEISKVCHAAYQWEAASAGVKASDTVKVVDTSAFVDYTPDRPYVWLAQTPQVFRVPIYRAAAYACRDEGFKGSDDNSLVEHLHIPVKMVQTHRENIKITEPYDLIFAHAVLEARRQAEENGETDPRDEPDPEPETGEKA